MKQHRGGAFLGFIIGLVVGLAAALAVAIYVTKVPIPFIDRSQSRNVEQDAAELKKNKNWDPNAALYGKNPIKPAAPASAPLPDVKPAEVIDPAKPVTSAQPGVASDPLGELAKARTSAVPIDPFIYFVQIGAFRSAEDAQSQRARLSLSGVEAKVSEREQGGRAVFRVRVGPFDQKGEAEAAKQKLDAAGLETALVRVQR